MKNGCTKWKGQLIEGALTGTVASPLEEHLRSCADCARELETLRARREQLDALLPLVARGATPKADFGARVLAAAQAADGLKRAKRWRAWALAGVTAVLAAALMMGWVFRRTTAPTVLEAEIAAAEKLAQWRAPSDVLLETPGQEILRTTPKLGESYLKIPVKTNEEE